MQPYRHHFWAQMGVLSPKAPQSGSIGVDIDEKRGWSGFLFIVGLLNGVFPAQAGIGRCLPTGRGGRKASLRAPACE